MTDTFHRIVSRITYATRISQRTVGSNNPWLRSLLLGDTLAAGAVGDGERLQLALVATHCDVFASFRQALA